jgi:ferredoxin
MLEGEKGMKKCAVPDKDICVSCGACRKVCPRDAISIWKGCYAVVDKERCVGCGICAKTCPAGCMEIKEAEV